MNRGQEVEGHISFGNSPANFWAYMRMIRFYDQTIFDQLKALVPARSKPTFGTVVEPNIFERPKTIIGRDPEVTTPHYSQSIDVSNDFIV